MNKPWQDHYVFDLEKTSPLRSGTNLVIRTATARDRSAWVRLRFQLWPHCPVARHRQEVKQVRNSAGVVALACEEKEVIGFAEASIRVDHVEGTTITPVPYLEGWYVLPRYRGRGVGRALLAFIENWAWEKGYKELASDAEIENKESIRLHGMLGFKEVERTVHFVKRFEKKP